MHEFFFCSSYLAPCQKFANCPCLRPVRAPPADNYDSANDSVVVAVRQVVRLHWSFIISCRLVYKKRKNELWKEEEGEKSIYVHTPENVGGK